MRKRCLGANGRSDLRACHFCGQTGSLSVAYRPYTGNQEYIAGIKCFNCGLTFEPPYTYDTPEEAVDEAVRAWNADSKRPNYVVGAERGATTHERIFDTGHD